MKRAKSTGKGLFDCGKDIRRGREEEDGIVERLKRLIIG